MDRHVDEVVAARQCLVDRVVDDLVDEVMEAPRPVEPMYIPGRRRTGSRPSRTGDVLCGVELLRPLKSPANRHIAGLRPVYQNWRSDRALTRLARAALATSSRRSGSSIAAGRRSRLRLDLGGDARRSLLGGAALFDGRRGSGIGPDGEPHCFGGARQPDAAHAVRRGSSSWRRGRARAPRSDDATADVQRSVAADACSGHACRATRLADDGRPGGGDRCERNRVAASAARELLGRPRSPMRSISELCPAITARACAGSPGSAATAVAVDDGLGRLARSCPRVPTPAVPSELGETSSRSTSGDVPSAVVQYARPPPSRGRAPRPAARPASRTTRRSRPPASIVSVVQMRPCACHAPLEVGSEPGIETRRRSRARPRNAASPSRAPALPADCGERSREERQQPPSAHEPAPRRARRLARPRPERVARRLSRRGSGAGLRSAARQQPRSRSASVARAGSRRPSARSRYASAVAGAPFTTARRSGVNTRRRRARGGAGRPTRGAHR